MRPATDTPTVRTAAMAEEVSVEKSIAKAAQYFLFQNNTELTRKNYIYDPDKGQAGGVYLWPSVEAAQRALGHRLRHGLRHRAVRFDQSGVHAEQLEHRRLDPAALSVVWDVGGAAAQMMLVAWELGIGSCPATVYEHDLARRRDLSVGDTITLALFAPEDLDRVGGAGSQAVPREQRTGE